MPATLLAKSEKAKLILGQRDTSLGVKDRQILILCNGTRTSQELIGLFGGDTGSILDRFVRSGLLVDACIALAGERGVRDASATSRAGVITTSSMELKPLQDATASLNARSKRSLAASKMYMINLLQMHRDLDSSTLAVNIHTSEDEQQLVACLLASLRYIARKAGPEYGKRIADQLGNILPENYLPDLNDYVEECLYLTAPAPVSKV